MLCALYFFCNNELLRSLTVPMLLPCLQELVPDSPAMSTLLKQLSGDDEKHNAADGKKRIPFNVGED